MTIWAVAVLCVAIGVALVAIFGGSNEPDPVEMLAFLRARHEWLEENRDEPKRLLPPDDPQ